MRLCLSLVGAKEEEEEEEEAEVREGDDIKCIRKRKHGFDGGSEGSLSFCSNKGSPTLQHGYHEVVPICPVHDNFLRTFEASRSHAFKKVWEYVKLYNLQNPTNKKEIFCDATLKTIFARKDTVGFPEIARLLSQHFIKSSA